MARKSISDKSHNQVEPKLAWLWLVYLWLSEELHKVIEVTDEMKKNR